MRKARSAALACLRRFARERQGGVAPLLAIAALPLLVSAGAAIDFSRAESAKTAMQGALDSTAFAIIHANAQGTTAPDAQNFFNAAFNLTGIQNVTVTSTVTPSSGGTTASLRLQGR